MRRGTSACCGGVERRAIVPIRPGSAALRLWLLLAAASGIYLAACNHSSSGDATNSSTAPSAGGTTGNCPAGAFDGSLGCIQDLVFTPRCAGCHSGSAAPQGLSLDTLANSRDLTVGVASSEVPTLRRVAPADAANSYLYQKVLGTAAVGTVMPAGGSPLSKPETDAIRDWINSLSATATPGTAPVAPTGLTAAAGNQSVSLTWTSSAGASGYTLYRSSSLPVNLSTATKTTGVASGVADTAGIVNGTTYYYAVTAVNSAGESPASNEASATPSAASPSVAPPAPTGLAATTGNASITLTWSASAGATSYTLYRSSRSPVTLSTATRTPGVASGVVDTAGIANATTYTYVVTAVNVAGESAASNEIAATPMPNCPAGAFDGSLGCLQDLIFTPTCSGCHAGASPPQGLSLDSLSNTRAMTVNMSSAEQPSVLRVKPAAAANSYLYLKVTGASGITGVQMPSGGSPLTSAQTEAIAGWIGAGAP